MGEMKGGTQICSGIIKGEKKSNREVSHPSMGLGKK